jgi:hypothetical protein
MLANVTELPAADPSFEDSRMQALLDTFAAGSPERQKELQGYAKELLAGGKVREAWQVLLAGG